MTGSKLTVLVALVAVILTVTGAAMAQTPEKVTIVVFGPPSLGAFLPPIIKVQQLERLHPVGGRRLPRGDAGHLQSL
ncbi:MAG: hypothetical protein HYU51_04175 [Candidatus Rokubacteria bacterium]|nr:hypothetical protein [Candidatus Rokubacteria bacterium]